MKLQKAIYPIVNTVIRILLLLIIAGMCLQSMFSTSFIGVITNEDGTLQERTLNIADQPWKHLLVFLIFTVAGMVLYRGIRSWHARRLTGRTGDGGGTGAPENQAIAGGTAVQENQPIARTQAGHGRNFLFYCIIVLILGTLWLLVTQLYPSSDPAKVYQIAMQWRRGDFSAYAEGGYLFRYPFQAGIILFYYLMSFLFGIDNYIGLQFVNVIALAAVYGLLVKLSMIFWPEDKKLPRFVYAALILWVPLAFYVTYLYGILPGMALSLGAVYFAAMYLHTRRYRYILPAALCMGLATVIKMNCLIYLVAIACFLLYDALDTALLTKKEQGRQWIASIACLVLMILSVAGCNQVCSRYVEHLSGYKAGEGEVMVSWVVMGLQETPLGPGGYSGYINEIFERYEYDTEKITEASIADIKKIMTRMSENPLDEGLPFFARKNAFQWNDPTFISLDRTKGRKAAGNMPEFAHSLIEGKGSVTLSVLLNYAQTLILIGAIMYLIMDRKSRNIYELMGVVIFLGGFLFHFFWESSASYTIPYFVILIPYAVKGLADWIRYADRVVPDLWRDGMNWCKDQKKKAQHGTAKEMGQANEARQGNGVEKKNGGAQYAGLRRGSLCVLAVVILTVLFSRTNLFRRTIALDDGETAAMQFYHRGENGAGEDSRGKAGILEGYYYLSPYLAQDIAVITQGGKLTTVSVIPFVLDGNNIAGSVNGSETQAAAGNVNGSETLAATEDANAVTKVSKARDIDNKILLWKESGSVYMRFRSNEQVLAIDRSGDTAALTTYLDDGMNTFYKPKEEMSYRWKLHSAENGSYYITIDDLALTYRNGEVTLSAMENSDDQKWILQP